MGGRLVGVILRLVIEMVRLIDIFFPHAAFVYFCSMNKSVFNQWMEILAHAAIWVGYSFLVFSVPIASADTLSLAWFYVLRALVVNSLLFYVNIYVLLPRYIAKSRYLGYILITLALLMITTLMFQYTEHWFGLDEFKERMGRFSEHFNGMEGREGVPPLPDGERGRPMLKPLLMGPTMAFGFMSALGILFISTIFWMMNETRMRRQREMALVTENLMTEMKFLKSQINPHFLFNALNNIYSLSRLRSEKAPDMILKLSDMLRFVLYESEDKKVPLGREMDYIYHYVDFQKIKIEGEPRIVMDMDGADRMLKIEPMLLIPFVENCFKHSKIEDVRHGWMHMKLTTAYDKLYFVVVNSLPSTAVQVDPMGGIGIENVKKRLNFLYPGKHRLDIERKDKEYRVELVLELK